MKSFCNLESIHKNDIQEIVHAFYEMSLEETRYLNYTYKKMCIIL